MPDKVQNTANGVMTVGRFLKAAGITGALLISISLNTFQYLQSSSVRRVYADRYTSTQASRDQTILRSWVRDNVDSAIDEHKADGPDKSVTEYMAAQIQWQKSVDRRLARIEAKL